jgi:hypothetical protein
VTRFALIVLLALGLASAGLWAWSFRQGQVIMLLREDDHATERFFFEVTTRTFGCGYQGGVIDPDVQPTDAPWSIVHRTDPPLRFRWTYAVDGPWWERLGFYFDDGRRNLFDVSYLAEMPAWFVVLTLAALTIPSARVLRRERRQRQRRAAGACESCGYDLRGAAHERCPECGAGVVPAPV